MKTIKLNLKTLKAAAGILLSVGVQQVLAQNPVLSVPGNYVKLSGPAALPLPTGDYTGAAAVYGHNAMADADGNLAFFMVDDNIYDKNGVWLAWLNLPGSTLMAPSPEIAIVPKPGSCTKYYLFYGLGIGGLGTTEAYYSELDVTAASTAINCVNMTSMLPSGGSWARSRVAFAATKVRTDGSRFIFVYSGLNSVYRYKITASGITYDGYTYNVPGSVSAGDQHAEFELYETSGGGYKFALSSKTSTLSAGMVHTATLSTAGAVTAAATHTFPAASLSEKISISGLEYSPDGNYLYVTHTTSASNTEPFQYIHLNTGVLGALAVTGKNDFQNSYIELGRNGRLYLATSNRLATLANPNTPNVANWTNSALTVTSTPITHPGSSMPSVYVLPDQVDGMDYTAHFFQNTILAAPSQTICAGNCAAITFSTNPATGASATLYPGGTTVSSPFNVCPGSSTTYTLTNAATGTCQKSAEVKITVIPFAGNYDAHVINQSPCTPYPPMSGNSKPICLTPGAIASTMPSNTNLALFRCLIGNSPGWEGAGGAGITNFNVVGSYTVEVYEADASGNRKVIGGTTAPAVFLKYGIDPAPTLILRFNDFGNGAGATVTGPFYSDGTADGTGVNGTGDYFRDRYENAFNGTSGETLSDFSNVIFCVDMKQNTGYGCIVSKKSYFKIANNGLLNGRGARMAQTGEEESEVAYLSLEIFPNPTNSMVYVPLNSDDTHVTLTLTDNLGKQVMNLSNLENNKGQMNLENLPAGIYFYTIVKNNVSYKGKIVKQ